MPKITFMGAGSSVFAKNVLGDCMTSPIMENSEIALYDIDADRMDDSKRMLDAINRNLGNKATIKTYLGVENRKDALRGANYRSEERREGKECANTGRSRCSQYN